MTSDAEKGLNRIERELDAKEQPHGVLPSILMAKRSQGLFPNTASAFGTFGLSTRTRSC